MTSTLFLITAATESS